MRKLNPSLFIGILSFLILTASYAADERSITIKPKEKRDLAVEAKKGLDIALVDTKYYALIIGNNNYKHIQKLKTAVNDAKDVERILKSLYGFETKLLIDAPRKEILTAVNDFRKKLSSKDNLLIYYAGHGEYDKTADRAYWLPVDAQRDDPVDWISATDITDNIKRIASRHILIVSDSCYSGTLSRAAVGDISTKGGRDEFIKKMIERSSRTLMASGGNEPVADEGGGNNSVFAAAFLKALNEADKPLFTAEELFHGRVKIIVAGKSEQVPEYNDIRNSGHEGGDFVFTLKIESLSQVNLPSPPFIKGGTGGISGDEGGLSASTPPAPVVLQGHLQVNVNAPSTRVFINGDEKGIASPGSPLNMENFPTGTVSVKVEAEGYEALEKMVTIQRNQWTQEVFELKRAIVANLSPPPPPVQPKPRLAEKDNMVLIPSGEFLAGEPNLLKGIVVKEFYIDKYEITQREYEQVMGNNPSFFKGTNNPVEQVTWYEADEYCRKVGKRLPTEWEWEKAAKAGTTTAFYWGETERMADDYAWYNKNSGYKTHPVGEKKPNGYGLYDMAGNVWEWTATDYDNSNKVLRGGSWSNNSGFLWSDVRGGGKSSVRNVNFGFRCIGASGQ